MSLEYTLLQCIKTDPRSTLSPDAQLCEMVKMLDGKLKTWFIVAPTPQVRELYFEADDGEGILKPETGLSETHRNLALGKETLKQKKRGRKKKKTTNKES